MMLELVVALAVAASAADSGVWIQVCPAEDGRAEDACPELTADKKAAAVIDGSQIKVKKGSDPAYAQKAKDAMLKKEPYERLADKQEADLLADEAYMLVNMRLKLKAKSAKAEPAEKRKLAEAAAAVKAKIGEVKDRLKGHKDDALKKALAPAVKALEKAAAQKDG